MYRMWLGREREKAEGGSCPPRGARGPHCKPLQSPTSPYKPTTVKPSLVGPTQGKPYTLHRGYCSNCFVDH